MGNETSIRILILICGASLGGLLVLACERYLGTDRSALPPGSCAAQAADCHNRLNGYFRAYGAKGETSCERTVDLYSKDPP